MADVIAARAALISDGRSQSASWWVDMGALGTGVFAGYNALQDDETLHFLTTSPTHAGLYAAAARLAYAIETTAWDRWRGATDIALDLPTPVGWFRVRDAGVDTYEPGLSETVLLLDLGGDDVYRDSPAANSAGGHGVNVTIDLAGADDYGYPVNPDEPVIDGLSPADAAGRNPPGDQYGPVTLSRIARQGGARAGVALHFDLGSEGDVYRSLAQSQGYAHLGVGVLYDAGGNDTYLSESGSQGAATFGIGLLIDGADGDDTYHSFSTSQASAGPLGFALLADLGGDDTYIAEPGHDGADNPLALYFSPQMPKQANNSASQGAGMGIRWDAGGVLLSGGIAVLHDRTGNDRYTCGVFCQGAGFWQGLGLLHDGGGADAYDGLWYIQGGAAHYAIGALVDAGAGADVFNAQQTPRNVSLGTGHDYSLGLLMNLQGDDTYNATSLSLGASSCNGIGLFVDAAGDDMYRATSTRAVGLGSHGECLTDEDRVLALSVGILLDAGGVDDWTYPESETIPSPANDSVFGHAATDSPTERGIAVDADDATGLPF